MYNNADFKAKTHQEIIDFMYQNPFVILCGVDANQKPVATHIPVIIEQRNEQVFLLAHIMKKQLHTIAFENNANVLAIFSAAHSYISATNYAQQNTASTWNYQAVHASGTIKFLGEKDLHNILATLTKKFENNPNSAALVDKMDTIYLTKLMKAIVAFEIEITNMEHVFKLSQNKDAATQTKIIDTLEKSENVSQSEVAKAMKNYL